MYSLSRRCYILQCCKCIYQRSRGWVGSKVAGMKISIFDIFDPNLEYVLGHNDPSMELLKQHFNFQFTNYYVTLRQAN